MANINLPSPGEDPNWAPKLNAAILAINSDVEQLQFDTAEIVVGVGQEFSDLNDLDRSGRLTIQGSALNRPTPDDGSGYRGINLGNGSLSTVQIVTRLAGGTTWIRSRQGGTWDDWQRIVDEDRLQAVVNARVAGLVDELDLTTDPELDARVSGLVDELDLMQDVGQVSDLNILPDLSCVLSAPGMAANTPGPGGWTVLHKRFNAGVATQFAISGSNGSIYTRRYVGGEWQPWEQVARFRDLDESGLLAKKSVHKEEGAWVWDGPDGDLATHYVIPDHTGAYVVRSSTFPIPDATPSFTW